MKRRKPLRKIGSYGLRYLAVRQTFLERLLNGRERVMLPCGMRLGTEGPYADPQFAAEGECEVWIDPSPDAPDYRRLRTNGHIHHEVARSRAPEKRLDLTNLVLLTPAKHQEVESRYQKGGV